MAKDEMTKRVEILSTLFGCYGQATDTNRLAIYAKVLKDFSPMVLAPACQKLMLESKFLPSVAEIVQAAKSVSDTQQGKQALSGADDYVAAWEEVKRALNTYGIMRKPEWSSDVIEKAVRAVGWRNLNMADERTFATLHAQFRDAFRLYQKRKEDNALNCYVLGIASSDEGVMLPIGKMICLNKPQQE